jgi:hypothetical protein
VSESHIGKEGTGAVMRLTGPGEEPHAAAVLRSWRASAAGNCVDWKVYRVRRAVFWHPMVRKKYHSGGARWNRFPMFIQESRGLQDSVG